MWKRSKGDPWMRTVGHGAVGAELPWRDEDKGVCPPQGGRHNI